MTDTITLEELERGRLEARVALLERQVRTVAGMVDGGIALKYVDPSLYDKQQREFWWVWWRAMGVVLLLLAISALAACLS